MTRLTSLRHSYPSHSHRQPCGVAAWVWMFATINGLSGQLGSDRRVEINSITNEKFNLDPIQSGWHLRLMPM